MCYEQTNDDGYRGEMGEYSWNNSDWENHWIEGDDTDVCWSDPTEGPTE
jgi:hypothetical protein